MTDVPVAGWKGDHAVVTDAASANRLFNKHGVGAPQSGNSLRLHPVEAAWLLAAGRIRVDGADLAALLVADHADVAYLCYRDLRERGLRVQPADADGRFAVWPRGAAGSDPPQFHVIAVSERDPVTAELLVGAIGAVVGAVDEDGSVTYYEAQEESPAGRVGMTDLGRLEGTLVGDHVLVTGDAAALGAEGVGTPHETGLVLSLMEAAWLARRRVLRVDADLEAEGARRQHHFARTWPAYLALRAAGAVPRSGFRFGTHLRAYDALPDKRHARWLVDCLAADDEPHWSRLSRGVRLAHGVRKRFLVAIVATDGPVRFVRLDWFRP